LKYSIEYVRKLFEKENYTLLSEDYVNTKSKLEYISPKGYKGSISLDKWLLGRRHPKENNRYYNINIISNILKSQGYTLLNSEYNGSKSKIYYRCDTCGTKNSVTWNQWNYKKNKCRGCLINNKKELFISNVESDGYNFINGEYKDNRSKLTFICQNKHEYMTNEFNWKINGSRCPICNCIGESQPERDLISYISNLGMGCTHKDKSLIGPKELDIVIHSKKIAIEYCGLYWHSELMGKDRNYHLGKLKACEEKGYRLITIFEDEWNNNRRIVESRIERILCLTNNTIYARKTKVREISTQEAKRFCEENHLQGYTGSKIKIGLYYENNLISVMTFSKPSLSKGQKNPKDGVWELSRFCSKLNYKVIGGASKLLAYFKRNYEWEEIFSYADRRWSNGDLYENIGFSLEGETPPNYWYSNDTNLKCKRLHRFALRKKNNEPYNATEIELRSQQGYYRIWDCGSLKYGLSA